MSFFNMIKSKINKNSLPYHYIEYLFSVQFNKKTCIRKRAFLFTLLRGGSLTIEAACVFPMFLAVCVSVLFFGELFRLEARIDEALFNTTKVYSQYVSLMLKGETVENSLAQMAINGIGVFTISNAIKSESGEEFLDASVLAGGSNSLSFLQTEISENYVDIIVTYNVRFKAPFLSFAKIPIVQRCKMHTWSGKEKSNEGIQDDILVYITRTGSVYHLRRECTYIKLKIMKTALEGISEKRNSSGAKYYPCERCAKGKEINNQVYYTKDGTRYHNSIECSELKRVVYEVKLSEVKNSRRPCSKCGS